MTRVPPDPDRPLLHLTPVRGWMNDPHGLTYHEGRYHLFFQSVPGRTTWGAEQHWGHATSEDLLHWTRLGVALSPGDGDLGVWSGSIAVPDHGQPALFYTSAREPEPQIGRVRIARPTDRTWSGWEKGPVVVDVPADVDVVAFRDPFVLPDPAGWRMLVGAGMADGTAAALTWTSADLETWSYDGVLAARHSGETEPWTGTMWECPQLVRVADRWVLIVSAWSQAGPDNEAYAIGDLVGGRFVAQSWGRLSYGPSSYAGSVFTDADGAPCLIHWMRGATARTKAWVGAHSLPQRLELQGSRLRVRPHPAVAGARTGEPAQIRGHATLLPDPCDIELTLDDPAATAGLSVTGDHVAPVRLDAHAGTLTVQVGDDAWELPTGGREIRVVLDGATLEVFTAAGSFGAAAPGASTRTLRCSGSATAHAFHLA